MRLKALVLLSLIVVILSGCGKNSVYSDGEGKVLKRDMEYKTAGIITDKETGCQYISVVDAGITPRLDVDGKVFGCKGK